MSENGTKIPESAEGNIIASRSARETRASDSGAREVQLVDFAQRELAVTRVRGSAAWQTSDPSDPTAISGDADFWDNYLDIGDKTTLVVLPLINYTFSSTSGYVTPVVYDTQDNMLGILEAKAITEHPALKNGSASLGGEILSPAMVWDVSGAPRVRLHLAQIGKSIKLDAGLI